MTPIAKPPAPPQINYPDSDGQPMGETPYHCRNLTDLVETLDGWYLPDPQVFVAGNMFMYYMPGNPRRHVSPDVFVVKGVPKTRTPERRRYLVWEEGKGPDAVMELTSSSTSEADLETKFLIYQDDLKVPEYFLFDPYAEILNPPLVGYRLVDGDYVPIQPVDGRLPSEVLGLHLERDGWQVRLWNPATKQWLLTPKEEREARQRAEGQRDQAEAARQQEAMARQQEAMARQQAEAEVERLRREVEELRRNLSK